MDLISIIVPVYKVEDYINKCLDSIISQTYSNIEIILVDDGSPDNCGIICDEYAVRDKRIIVVHQENKGLSVARNVGLDTASGDYVCFVDSDDWIEKNSLDGIVESIKKANYPDVIETRLTYCLPDGSFEQRDNSFDDYISKKGFDYESALFWITHETENVWPAQKKIIKKTFIDKHNLRFKEGILHEDVLWTSNLCMAASSFGYYEKTWYFYRKEREGAITSSVKKKNVLDLLYSTRELYEQYINDNNLTSYYFFADALADVLGLLKRVKTDDVVFASDVVAYNKDIITPRFCVKKKHKLFCYAVRLFGEKIALSVLVRLGKVI